MNLKINYHFLVAIALLYLAIGDVLFMFCWFQPWVAMVVMIGIVATIAIYYFNSTKDIEYWILTRSDSCKIVVAFVLISLPLLSTGIMGFYGTHWDYYSFRQAFYLNLIDAPYPIILPDGREMTYYLAGMLPASILSRFTNSSIVQQFILYAWNMIAYYLVLLIAYHALKRTSLLFVFLLLFFHDPLTILFPPFDGSAIGMKAIRYISYLTDIPFDAIGSPHTAQNCIGLSVNTSALFATSAPMLATIIIMTLKKYQTLIIPLIIALLLPCSPLGALFCFFVAAFAYFRNLKIREFYKELPKLIIPLFLAVTCAVYYLRGEGDTVANFTISVWGWLEFLLFYSRTILLSLLFIIPVWYRVKSDSIFVSFCLATLFVMFFFIGSSPESGMHGFNELWLKSSTTVMMVLIFYWCKYVPQKRTWKYLPVFIASIFAYFFMLHLIKGFSFSTDVRDDWNGHVAHNHKCIYQKIPNCHSPIIPGLLLTENGESEKRFPAFFLPKAKGCDYTRQPNVSSECR